MPVQNGAALGKERCSNAVCLDRCVSLGLTLVAIGDCSRRSHNYYYHHYNKQMLRSLRVRRNVMGSSQRVDCLRAQRAYDRRRSTRTTCVYKSQIWRLFGVSNQIQRLVTFKGRRRLRQRGRAGPMHWTVGLVPASACAIGQKCSLSL